MLTLLIVDDHDLLRTGLRGILAADAEIEVVGEAASGDQAIRMNRALEPDVILMDINMPGMSGFETTERILRATPRVKIIVLTAYAEQPFPTRLLDMGAAGYLTKGCDATELLRAVHAVAQGERYIGAAIAQQLAVSLLPGANDSPFAALSGREMEVALMLSEGMNVKTIGEALSLSPKTAATYKYRVYEKTGSKNEVELLRQAIRYGVIDQV